MTKVTKGKEPNFLDNKWHLSTKGIWHKVRGGRYLCKRAVGKVKAESFDVDQSENVCRNCIHLLTRGNIRSFTCDKGRNK